MKKKSVIGIIVSEVLYLLLFILGSSTGAIHPACYAYVGTILPFGFAFLYFYVASNIKFPGAAVLLNAFVTVGALIYGEGNLVMWLGMLILTVLSEVLRGIFKYDTLKGVRWGFIPFAFSFYTYTFHWWTNTEYSLSEALEEMPEGYAAKMEAVINNTPGIVIALILVIPVAIIAIRLAQRLMPKSRAKLN